MKGSGAVEQRPYKLLWMLWFNKKSISKNYIYELNHGIPCRCVFLDWVIFSKKGSIL